MQAVFSWVKDLAPLVIHVHLDKRLGGEEFEAAARQRGVFGSMAPAVSRWDDVVGGASSKDLQTRGDAGGEGCTYRSVIRCRMMPS